MISFIIITVVFSIMSTLVGTVYGLHLLTKKYGRWRLIYAYHSEKQRMKIAEDFYQQNSRSFQILLLQILLTPLELVLAVIEIPTRLSLCWYLLCNNDVRQRLKRYKRYKRNSHAAR